MAFISKGLLNTLVNSLTDSMYALYHFFPLQYYMKLYACSMPEKRVKSYAQDEESRNLCFRDGAGYMGLMVGKPGNLILRINKSLITVLIYCKSGIMLVT